jgi:hypothetical protein
MNKRVDGTHLLQFRRTRVGALRTLPVKVTNNGTIPARVLLQIVLERGLTTANLEVVVPTKRRLEMASKLEKVPSRETYAETSETKESAGLETNAFSNM